MDHKDLSRAGCLKELDSSLLHLTTLAVLQIGSTLFDLDVLVVDTSKPDF